MKLVFTIILMLSFSYSIHAKLSDTFGKDFPVEENCQFSLENINGSVKLYGWDKQLVKIEAAIQYDNQQEGDRVSIYTEKYNNKIHVETLSKPPSSWSLGMQVVDVIYDVYLPTNATIARVKLVNGKVHVRDFCGDIEVKITNGDFSAYDVTGSSKIETVNGNVKIFYNKFGLGCCSNITTTNGNIEFSLSREANVSLYSHTFHGKISNSFNLLNEKFNGKTLKGEIGSGEVKVELISVNGNISILEYRGSIDVTEH